MMIGFNGPDSSLDSGLQTNVLEITRFKRCDTRKRILIVDDVEDIREMLRHTILKTFPAFQIVEASSGMMASIELRKNNYDLVISDVSMLDGDGIWLHFFMEQYHPATPLIFFACSPEHIPLSARSRKAFAKTDAGGLLKELVARWNTDETK